MELFLNTLFGGLHTLAVVRISDGQTSVEAEPSADEGCQQQFHYFALPLQLFVGLLLGAGEKQGVEIQTHYYCAPSAKY